MADTPNFWGIVERLVADDELDGRAASLVEAAMHSEAALGEALQSEPAEAAHRERPKSSAKRPERAFLRRVQVHGFRGVGPTSTLDLRPGPGLTLVIGRNGSGKSSFVEGLEMLLTGDSTRWTGKKPVADWRKGWRNLHAGGPVSLTATLTVEGSTDPVTVDRRWPEGAALGGSSVSVRRGSKSVDGDLSGLGWSDAVLAYRPFLSYNDISRAWDAGPSKLFDALMGMLGMDDIRAALTRLATARGAIDKRRKSSTHDRKALVAELEASPDPRAERCAELLQARTVDVDALDRILGDADDDDVDGQLITLRGLATLAAPTPDEVTRANAAIRAAIDAHRDTIDARGRLDLETAELLEHAVRWHRSAESADCPVCGTGDVLGDTWQADAQQRADALRQAATAADASRRAIDDAVRAARSLALQVRPPAADLVPAVAAAEEAFDTWTALPDDPGALADHLDRTHGALVESYATCRQQAAARLEALHVEWRPLRHRAEAWCDSHRSVLAEAPDLAALKAAEAWLKATDEVMRAEAFEPIAAQAKRTWGHLRAQSNVDIAAVTLKGSATRRSVDLDVTVDGAEGGALGVMSQGELHALALALFLPRLMRADSPFGFVFIDDPVQAMDPAKVDGLARVLRDAAVTHQVVVFTHDPRLPAAVRRLGIDATIHEVHRNPTSHVEVRIGQRPVEQHLSDAFHLADHRADLGDEVVRHVVPGLCRAAVEAALVDRTWREQLAGGRDHADIAAAIEKAPGLHDLATLAYFGDTKRSAELFKRLKRVSDEAVDVFVDLKRFAHVPLPTDIDVAGFVRATKRLAEGVLR